MTTAALYVRVSSEGQADNYSPETQEAAERAFAARHGFTVDEAHVYREVHTDGTSFWNEVATLGERAYYPAALE